ncbi:MAG TPA: glycoside hydrolase family 3 C-terminal domain-containing protein, partial [Ohtaekwangia sp.]|nr:glycoside hydrolase family 3 C-terminal domain-containing protein [Ohtaekwangia sp.]
QSLIRDIQALGKPVVLVLLNGSALAINWENENIPAIVEAWYPGQAAGQAIADVLFGDYNPGGKLPVTFYSSVKDLPPFDDYSISNQTYRYYKGKPLYPFGYGLSYTTFAYSNLEVKPQSKSGDSVRVSVQIKNTGNVSGDEVVQLYVSNLNSAGTREIHALKNFKRIQVSAGEIKTVDFILSPDAFAVWDDENKKVTSPGNFKIFVGGGQPTVKTNTQESTGLSTIVKVL